MVWVFRTSLKDREEVESILHILDNSVCNGGRWNIDLEDSDRILRIESEKLELNHLLFAFASKGILCEELPD